jgi:hypothetical protein
MPFDPTKPANNAPNSSAEMRAQLTGLNDNINSVANGAGSRRACRWVKDESLHAAKFQ